MEDSVLKQAIEQAIKELESSGDIVVTSTIPAQITEKIANSVQAVSPNLLSTQEFSAVKNALNATWSGFHLSDWDFQTHIGLTREQLKAVLDKLGSINESA